MAFLKHDVLLQTWYVQVAKAVSCSAGDDVTSLSSTLDISDTTACPCGGAAERSYTCRSDRIVINWTKDRKENT